MLLLLRPHHSFQWATGGLQLAGDRVSRVIIAFDCSNALQLNSVCVASYAQALAVSTQQNFNFAASVTNINLTLILG